ncbi:hypothetical protein PISMIDRAFT_689607 [Pisolithus microcarpus 441]|uniref:Uncharacterized protein n=1 Tax=Pisolithus microcarpus 441 TaxID=765257 RepID=A0A0C9YWJ0_9AGAM|nr:hypothetical protein PISMIDRAFT_689607 [Pisolithus microcarpus 441]
MLWRTQPSFTTAAAMIVRTAAGYPLVPGGISSGPLAYSRPVSITAAADAMPRQVS